MKIINFQRENDVYIVQSWSDQAVKGTGVNQTCHSKKKNIVSLE